MTSLWCEDEPLNTQKKDVHLCFILERFDCTTVDTEQIFTVLLSASVPPVKFRILPDCQRLKLFAQAGEISLCLVCPVFVRFC